MWSILVLDKHPLDRLVRCLILANVDSMGLVVRMLFQCVLTASLHNFFSFLDYDDTASRLRIIPR
ncbi:MAG: hypothetical protein ACI9UN_003110 [Granulosicoccus sp.]|jgi:hypothetical protein